jgi:hypothetical protein
MAAALASEVVECTARTLAEARVRIEFTRDLHFAWPEQRDRVRRRGGLLRPVAKLAKASAKQAGKAAWRHWMSDVDPRHQTAEGIIEPPTRRHMVDFGSYAELYKDGKRWGGRSGRSLATLEPWPEARGQIDLWWLLDALRGTVEARLEGEEALHGVPTRRIAARVDLARASALAPRGLQVPSVARFEELAALPLTVWIDREHVRRARFEEGDHGATTLTLDLLEFDPATADVDWDRLPTFRSPEEEAAGR